MKILCIDNQATIINLAYVTRIYANGPQVIAESVNGGTWVIATAVNDNEANNLLNNIATDLTTADVSRINDPTPDTMESIL